MSPVRHLVIFARAPMVGAGKRRLAAGIGAVQAARFQRVRLAAAIATLGRDPRWQTWLALTPDHARCWSHRLGRQPQGRGDLGQRLSRVVKSLPQGPVVVIGSDIPEIEPGDINEAFRRLAGHDAVLGPALDGGYWLVGLRRTPRLRLPFRCIRWSSEHALADTERELDDATISRLRTLADVDDAASLARHPRWARRI
jgi:rSAM/selenodomain-associated transferase 1